jgi:hypothetical protein
MSGRIAVALATCALLTAAAPALAAGPPRVFHLDTPRYAAKAGDGSTITAFGAVLDSADGTGQIVLAVATSGHSIAVVYGGYKGNDPFCCPSSKKTVRYRWNGSRIVADGTPPLVYGRKGSRLHLAPRR